MQNTATQKCTIFINGKPISVGEYTPATNTFTKRIQASKHIHRKTDSIGISASVYTEYIAPNRATMKVYDTESGATYTASYDVFEAHKISMNFGDPQYFLPLKWWERSQENQQRLV